MVRISKRPCWRERGFLATAGYQADAVLRELLVIVKDYPGWIVRAALDEAIFREHELPGRTKCFQRSYLKKNGAK